VPSGRRVLADQAVHGLPEEVSVPGMPAVLLDQVAKQPAQAGMSTIGGGCMNELVQAAVGQGRIEP
jgi:hypothetical protein